MQNSHRRRRLLDRLARWVVTAGGFAIIASVLGILLFILAEVYPLLLPPSHRLLAAARVEGGPLFVGCEEYDEVAYSIHTDGAIRFLSLADGLEISSTRLQSLGSARISAVHQRLGTNRLDLGTTDGRVLAAELSFESVFRDDPVHKHRQLRTIRPSFTEGTPLDLDPDRKPIRAISCRDGPGGLRLYAAITGDGRLRVLQVTEKKTLSGVKRSDKRIAVEAPGASCLALERNLTDLYVGTTGGNLLHVDLRDPDSALLLASHAVGAPVTACATLNGDVSLVIGDALGNVGVWMQIRDAASPTGNSLRRIRGLEGHAAPVSAIWPSIPDKGVATSDTKGRVKLHHSTSDQTFFTLVAGDRPVRSAFLSPRSTAILALLDDGTLAGWKVRNPHPETTLRTLFGRVWYEGYEKPEFVWQSTGGTDDFEPKFSLVPLMFGTLKGTFYALVFGVPIALLGALFTSQFLHARIRGIVKPVIEIMAALPSVVLGFLAGLWLAPYMEKIVPAVFALALVLPLAALAAMALWQLLPFAFRARWREKAELVFLLGAAVAGVWICLQVTRPIETALFGCDFGQWWFTTTGLAYDQRNALVVGFAMGFAVIPIIFTISEDALANVPRHLSSGSLALGATRWQTAVRVVLPTASPGIFSAILVGFGRAVGETMIVLMATGNTPVMEWNLFNGFRTLSANIAVEIPEAPEGETLYRTLFLAALLLFLCTFIVNTLAEVIRIRMRRRYAQL
jgi:phosphate transport system permease protein